MSALVAVLLGLAGCARDLELPPPPAGPRLEGLAPAAAYAGELVEISGTGFAADPTANRVDFAQATAQGVAFGAGGLLVRVPADAGSGPLTVTTSRGGSAPSGAFGYLGLGQLRAGQVVQAAPLLHRPRAILLPGADPVLDSALFRGLVGTGAAPFARPRGFQRPVGSEDSIFLVDEAGDLVRLGEGNLELARVAFTTPPTLLGHVAATSRPTDALVLTVETDAAGGYLLTVRDADTLAPRSGPHDLGLKLQSELVDTGEGRVAVVAEDPSGAYTLAFIDPHVAPPAVTLLAAPSVPLQANPTVLAAGAGVGGVAAVALADGAVAVAGFGAAPDWLPGWRYERPATFSPSPITALAVTVGADVVVAKAAEGLVSGFPSGSSAPTWAFALEQATALAAASTGLVWAAGEADNWLVAIDASTGLLVGRRSADLGAAAGSVQAGAAYRPAGGAAAAVAFPVSRPPALVTWPLGGEPEALGQPLEPALVAWGRREGAFWIGDAAAVSLDGGGPLEVGGGLTTIGPTPAGLVALGGALSLIRDGVALPLADDLDSAIALPACSADGRLLAVGSMGGAERARLWSAEGLATGAPAALDVVVPGYALQGAFIDGQPWVSWLDVDTFAPRTARLAEDGTLLPPVDGLLPDGVPSPNGRTVLVPEPGLLGGGLTSLRVVALDPAAGFPTLERIELPAPLVGLAFDATGERLLVVTRAPDQLLVLE